jgi:5-(carboxyamino)imidazole ribonucleotide synthase
MHQNEHHHLDQPVQLAQEVMHLPNVYVHLYGKKITKPYRKMGHVTILHENVEEAIKNARLVQSILKVTSL